MQNNSQVASSINKQLHSGDLNFLCGQVVWREEALTSLAMSVYFCFSLGSSTAHQSAKILVAPRLSRRGCSCRTRERWRLQKRRKAFIGRLARCSLESSSASSVVLPHCGCEPCSWRNSSACWECIQNWEICHRSEVRHVACQEHSPFPAPPHPLPLPPQRNPEPFLIEEGATADICALAVCKRPPLQQVAPSFLHPSWY